ncbi:hypothetical protein E2C01_048548 [Portunus trituberculatus]|uniref:Uncharacterized protein n=1 Tax=Portunus trituberculatus TaxID=210409 RepID=A0A5B7GAV6_PORTR|nr:hypothetical protein [Portunus trituberculatus]
MGGAAAAGRAVSGEGRDGRDGRHREGCRGHNIGCGGGGGDGVRYPDSEALHQLAVLCCSEGGVVVTVQQEGREPGGVAGGVAAGVWGAEWWPGAAPSRLAVSFSASPETQDLPPLTFLRRVFHSTRDPLLPYSWRDKRPMQRARSKN